MHIYLFYVGEVESPRLLWSLFYNQEWVTVDQKCYHGNASPLPPNVHIVSDPDLSVAYTASIDEVNSHMKLRDMTCITLWMSIHGSLMSCSASAVDGVLFLESSSQ